MKLIVCALSVLGIVWDLKCTVWWWLYSFSVHLWAFNCINNPQVFYLLITLLLSKKQSSSHLSISLTQWSTRIAPVTSWIQERLTKLCVKGWKYKAQWLPMSVFSISSWLFFGKHHILSFSISISYNNICHSIANS